MGGHEKQLARLRRFNAGVRERDPELQDELRESLRDESLELGVSIETALQHESIVLRRSRPVLAVKQGAADLTFEDDEDSALWKARLTTAQSILAAAIRAVGRIELQGHADFAWVGTGWLVGPRILVTNRHVASTFASDKHETFGFRSGIDASVDFLQEIGRDDQLVFRCSEVLHIEAVGGPDLAFLLVEQVDGASLATPITLSARVPTRTPSVATIGYPAYDSRIPDADLMAKIYGRVYDKKRVAPGAVTAVEDVRLLHDCTTLGGNSGSVVLDLLRGEAVGLHFSGSFLRTNYAVRADVVKRRLDDVLAGRSRGGMRTEHQRSAPQRLRARAQAGATTLTIPLVVTVSLGEAVMGVPAAGGQGRSRALPSVRPDQAVAEAPIADYDDREGYRPEFLGAEARVALPVVVRGDVLGFDEGETELRYEHFSVVMSESRRMCRFSAVNIDGAQSKKTTRVGWRLDPRIPKDAQIMRECYGSAPKFSRGHMTRREDPAWGTAATARRGNSDSMHVTNTVPQMQSFNSPIWLGLEDYALQHAREDDMRISVFTGPYLEENDPVMFGVEIPRAFWKVIAFIHDDTGELCATGYEMSQEDNLVEPEFIFGQYTSPRLNQTTQVPIGVIESRCGIDLGGLAACDPMAVEGAFEDPGPLWSFEQIRLR